MNIVGHRQSHQYFGNSKEKAIFDMLISDGTEYNMHQSKIRFNYCYIEETEHGLLIARAEVKCIENFNSMAWTSS